MTAAWWGALVGATGAAGVLLVVSRLLVLRRPRLADRVLPYVRDLPNLDRLPALAPGLSAGGGTAGVPALVAPAVRWAADGVERVLGGASSVRRRLDRAGFDLTVHDFRVQQVLWGLTSFALAAAYCLVRSLAGHSGAASTVLLCAVAFVVGVLARDSHLSGQVKARERRILAEFPTVAELLALAVAAGEGPVAALDRVVARSGGDLSADLSAVLARVRTGEPVGHAFDRLAATTGLPLASPRASPWRSSVAHRSPTCCTPRRPTSGRPVVAS